MAEVKYGCRLCEPQKPPSTLSEGDIVSISGKDWVLVEFVEKDKNFIAACTDRACGVCSCVYYEGREKWLVEDSSGFKTHRSVPIFKYAERCFQGECEDVG